MQSHVDYIVQALIINTIFLKVFAPFEKSSILFIFFFDEFIKEVQTLHT